MPNTIPVLIVGAGPTGLSMASELHRHGIEFRIIDKEQKPIATSNALALHSRTLEIFEQMGLVDKVLTKGIKLNQFTIFADGKKIVESNFNLIDSQYPFALGLAQHHTEALLIEHLAEHNIHPEFHVEIADFANAADGFHVTLKNESGAEEALHADWLVACDGAHSFIRNQLNIPFEGQSLGEHFIMADAEIEWEFGDHDLVAFLSHHGPMAVITYEPGVRRILFEVTNDPELSQSTHPVKKDFERLAKERCPFPVTIGEPTWTSGFWINERIVPRYQQGRVLLAGDAAHIHSPVGGQGMNTGIQDAFNLAWKLALTIKGAAHQQLLNSYSEERRPIAQAVLRGSTAMTHVVASKNPLLRMVRNFVFGLINRHQALRKKVVNVVSEHNVNYEKSPIVTNANAHLRRVKVGDALPDCKVDFQNQTQRLFNILRSTQHQLLIFCGNDIVDADTLLEINQKVLEDYADYIQPHFIANDINKIELGQVPNIITDTSNELTKKLGIHQSTLVLVRPDQYIGFAGPAKGSAELVQYLSNRIFSF